MSLAPTMTEVAAAAEEAREEIEGVVLLAWTAAFSVLLDAVVAVLVVDLACLFVDEDFVGVGYGDKLLGGFVIATELVLAMVEVWWGGSVRVLVWVEFLAEVSVGFLDLSL